MHFLILVALLAVAAVAIVCGAYLFIAMVAAVAVFFSWPMLALANAMERAFARYHIKGWRYAVIAGATTPIAIALPWVLWVYGLVSACSIGLPGTCWLITPY